jgi:hypothetical protein
MRVGVNECSTRRSEWRERGKSRLLAHQSTGRMEMDDAGVDCSSTASSHGLGVGSEVV